MAWSPVWPRWSASCAGWVIRSSCCRPPIFAPCRAPLIRRFRWCGICGASVRRFATFVLTACTSLPRGRWVGQRGVGWSSVGWRFPRLSIRAFHRPSQAVLVTTERLREEFAGWDLQRLQLWRKGVDTRLFRPDETRPRPVRPVFLYVGRIAPEKNLQAFLDLELPGEKRVVGDGPQREALQQRYPLVRFLGYRHGQALAEAYQDASVLVFPSRTDTYGLVMLEALACGTPVAAFPVAGPLDVLQQGLSGVMAEDLHAACMDALELDRKRCAELAAAQSWRASALEFLALQPLIDGEPALAEALEA